MQSLKPNAKSGHLLIRPRASTRALKLNKAQNGQEN
jgi:hypothetical protein